jgi:hypothetical protein
MFEKETWFAWYPVSLRRHGFAWLQNVYRERSVTPAGATPWRYYPLYR